MWGQEKQPETNAAEPEREATSDITNGLAAENSEGIIAFVGKGVEFKGIISYSGTVRIEDISMGKFILRAYSWSVRMPSFRQKSRLELSCAKGKSPGILWRKNA